MASFSLPQLPYAYNALEPSIDAQTMEIHHTKHHQTYVDKLNAAVSGTVWESLPVEEVLRKIKEVPEEKRTAVRNHGGGHANHSLFWQILKPGGGGEPGGEIGKAIKDTFGDWSAFKDKFTQAAVNHFGSGWGWLSIENGKLIIENLPNQDSPLMEGRTPILGVDVWEHAYYLKYQNKRPDYVAAFWNIVSWQEVERRYKAAMGAKRPSNLMTMGVG
jgi:Fe-Mn family superoxide dismutase